VRASKKIDRPSRKKKVLIADASITIQRLVHLGLSGNTFEVIASSDFSDATQKIKTLKPDLILVDFALRGGGGLELIEKIRADSGLTHIKVILLKGSTDKESLPKSQQMLMDEILAKPFDARRLADIVHTVLLDEEKTPLVEPAESDQDEVTAKISPQKFKNPVRSEPTSEAEVTANAFASIPLTDRGHFEKVLREEIQQWIQKDLQPMAERILKEEILKMTKPK